MTFFVINLFRVLVWYFSIGGQIRSRHRYGGAKILTFQQNHNTTIALSVPKAGPNSIANFDGRQWPDLLPPGSATGPWEVQARFAEDQINKVTVKAGVVYGKSVGDLSQVVSSRK